MIYLRGNFQGANYRRCSPATRGCVWVCLYLYICTYIYTRWVTTVPFIIYQIVTSGSAEGQRNSLPLSAHRSIRGFTLNVADGFFNKRHRHATGVCNSSMEKKFDTPLRIDSSIFVMIVVFSSVILSGEIDVDRMQT